MVWRLTRTSKRRNSTLFSSLQRKFPIPAQVSAIYLFVSCKTSRTVQRKAYTTEDHCVFCINCYPPVLYLYISPEMSQYTIVMHFILLLKIILHLFTVFFSFHSIEFVRYLSRFSSHICIAVL